MSKEEPSLSVNVNGQSKVPPGFRFHPTEEELLHYYLRKKIAYEKIDFDVIPEIDLNKLEPWDIQEKCRIGSTPQDDWYFFRHKDKKYQTGTRTNRATAAGFWKSTGRDKVIHSSLRRTGMRKTLVFYKGRAPGQKSDWIMHEYSLDDNTITTQNYNYGFSLYDSTQEDGWVVCRVFKKKNYYKLVESPLRSPSTTEMQSLKKDGSVHDQFLPYINARSCKQEAETHANITTTYDYNPMQQLIINPINDNITTTHDFNPMQQLIINPINDRFLHMPGLDVTSGHLTNSTNTLVQDSTFRAHNSMTHLLKEAECSRDYEHLDKWVDVDRLVASQLNGYDALNDGICFSLDHDDQEPPQPSSMAKPNEAACTTGIDLWCFAQPSDPFYHFSV